MATTDDYMDISSGDEDESTVDYGLLRAVENCGATRFFDFDQSTREQYRRYDRTKAKLRKGKKRGKGKAEAESEAPMMPPVQEDEEYEYEEEYEEEDEEPQPQSGTAQEVELQEAEENEADESSSMPLGGEDWPLAPPKKGQPSAAAAEDAPTEDERGIPLKADGTPDKAKLWQRYRRLARAQLMEEGRSVKAAQVNAQAREWWLSDGWGVQ
jgi:hypothetical protein